MYMYLKQKENTYNAKISTKNKTFILIINKKDIY